MATTTLVAVLLWWPVLCSELVYPFELRLLAASRILPPAFFLALAVWVGLVVLVASVAAGASVWLTRRIDTDPGAEIGVALASLLSAILLATRLAGGLDPIPVAVFCIALGGALPYLVAVDPSARLAPLLRSRPVTWVVFAGAVLLLRGPGVDRHLASLLAGLSASAVWVLPIDLPRRVRAVVTAIGAASCLALAAPGRVPQPLAPSTGTPPAGDVVVVIVDTLRADRMSLFGHERPTTPFLDGLDGTTVFSQAWSPSSSTPPSVRALLTGWRAFSHGCRDQSHAAAPPDAFTLGRALHAAGYRTGFFGANGIIDLPGNLTGFEEVWILNGLFSERPSTLVSSFAFGGTSFWDAARWYERVDGFKEPGGAIVDTALTWLRGDPRPAAMVVHIFDPHWPTKDHGYPLGARTAFSPRSVFDFIEDKTTRPESRAELDEMLERYDQEIRKADDVLRDLFAGLAAAGRLDEATVVIVGDHGEEYFEHDGFGHGHDVMVEQVHVPLVIRWPASRRTPDLLTRVDAPVSVTDVYPTLDALLGLGARERLTRPFDGVPLVEALDGHPPGHAVVSETFYPDCVFTYRSGDLTARGVLVASEPPGPDTRWRVHDLSVDPQQLQPLDAPPPEFIAEATRAARTTWSAWPERGSAPEAPAATDDPELEMLKALGYAQ